MRPTVHTTRLVLGAAALARAPRAVRGGQRRAGTFGVGSVVRGHGLRTGGNRDACQRRGRGVSGAHSGVRCSPVAVRGAQCCALQVDKRAACMSKAIKNMLAPDSALPLAGDAAATSHLRLLGAFMEAKSGKVKFEEIKSDALAMVVKFMEYKLKLVNRRAST